MHLHDLNFHKLQNNYCKLVPLAHTHHDQLVAAASDGELWNLPFATIPKPEDMLTEINRRLKLEQQCKMLPFTVIHNDTQSAVGMTSYCALTNSNKEVDIGWTWYAKTHQRTALNTNCKSLLLAYAFETMLVETVFFKVHHDNIRSQNAVQRLGAIFHDTIKNYQTMPGKPATEYYHYKITQSEWPAIKALLIKKALPLEFSQ